MQDASLMALVEALQDVTVLVSGKPLVMRRGFRYSCTQVEAQELARAGYVRVLTAVPEIERAVMETGEKRKRREVRR